MNVIELQEAWSKIKPTTEGRYKEDLKNFELFEGWLGSSGLDRESDETYDLLESGLTHKGFHDIKTSLMVAELLDTYHTAMKSTYDGHDKIASGDNHLAQRITETRYQKLGNITNSILPRLEIVIQEHGLPAACTTGVVNPRALIELAAIRQMATYGLLKDEYKQCALQFAKDSFCAADELRRHLCNDDLPHSDRLDMSYKGIWICFGAIGAIKRAKELYAPATISYEDSYTSETVHVDFSLEALSQYHSFFTLHHDGCKKSGNHSHFRI